MHPNDDGIAPKPVDPDNIATIMTHRRVHRATASCSVGSLRFRRATSLAIAGSTRNQPTRNTTAALTTTPIARSRTVTTAGKVNGRGSGAVVCARIVPVTGSIRPTRGTEHKGSRSGGCPRQATGRDPKADRYLRPHDRTISNPSFVFDGVRWIFSG